MLSSPDTFLSSAISLRLFGQDITGGGHGAVKDVQGEADTRPEESQPVDDSTSTAETGETVNLTI